MMIDLELNAIEWTSGNDEPRVTVVLKRNDKEVVRRDARVFSEDDMIAASNELREVGGLASADADQWLAELIEPIRRQWLQNRDGQPNGEQAPAGPLPVVLQQYVAVMPSGDGNGPREPSTRDALKDRVLMNCVLRLEEDLEVQDDIESRREFAGTLTTASDTAAFRISAADFADNSKLKAALFAAAGCGLVIHGHMDEVRRAISTISKDAGTVRKRKLTTNFGWTADKKAYLTPSIGISEVGIEVLDEQAEVRVDLGSEVPACHLDLKKLAPDELLRIKRHIVTDLLALNDRTVTHTLLGATAAAVLHPFVQGPGRFALWLVGLTGSGKSFTAKMFTNLFGDFPVSSAPFVTWSSTSNFIQRAGYFHKDAPYLVDDYKPEQVKYPAEVVRVLQAYADNAARGRLRSDATANMQRPIRGLLVCTGEDVPEHHASAIARSVIVRVPNGKQNREAGKRCLTECRDYAGVTADFIRWLLAEGRTAVFVERFAELQARLHDDVTNQQNGIRIASNLALLGAAFEQFAEYLGDVWEGWKEAVKVFVEEDLVAIRDAMLGEAKEQQASEVFLRTLAELVRFSRVRIDGLPRQLNAEHKPLVGRVVERRPVIGLNPPAAPNQDRLQICTSLALAEVNGCLRQQGRSELKITESALLQQLREAGKLLDRNGEPLAADADPTRRVRLNGAQQVRAFVMSRRELLGDEV